MQIYTISIVLHNYIIIYKCTCQIREYEANWSKQPSFVVHRISTATAASMKSIE